jgi:hypothetical protein
MTTHASQNQPTRTASPSSSLPRPLLPMVFEYCIAAGCLGAVPAGGGVNLPNFGG